MFKFVRIEKRFCHMPNPRVRHRDLTLDSLNGWGIQMVPMRNGWVLAAYSLL